jgi:hypothetical protein
MRHLLARGDHCTRKFFRWKRNGEKTRMTKIQKIWNLNQKVAKPFTGPQPQTMDIVDMAIRLVVCQKSDFHGNSDFQNSF